jgi:hypothetical protein
MKITPGYFRNEYGPLVGKAWVRALPKEERQAFSYVGRKAAEHGRMGGVARAATATRDHRVDS